MGFLDSVTKMLSGGDTSAIAAQAVRAMGGSSRTASLVGMVGKAVQGDKKKTDGATGKTQDAKPAGGATAGGAADDPFAVPTVSDASARCFNRVALLNVAGWRDGDFSDSERLVLYRYIRDSTDLDADTRLELMREIERPPAETKDFWQKAKDSLSFEGLFADKDHAQTFSSALEQLVKADGSLDAQEAAFVQMVQKACGIG